MRSSLAAFCLLAFNSIAVSQTNIPDSLKPSIYIAFCENADKVPLEPINLSWVEKDKRIIVEQINRLPFVGHTLTGIKQVVPHFLDAQCNCSTVTHDLGYGLTLTQHTIYGGYSSHEVKVLHCGDRVIKMSIALISYRTLIKDHLLNYIGLPFICDGQKIVYDTVYIDNYNAYRIAQGALFLESNDSNQRRQRAMDNFTDVMRHVNFTSIEPKLSARIFDDVRYFIANKDYEALEHILYAPNPTSRILAARTLLYMAKRFKYQPEKAVNKRIQEALTTNRALCIGYLSCDYGTSGFRCFDIVEDFDQLLLTQ